VRPVTDDVGFAFMSDDLVGSVEIFSTRARLRS
jgi:hypothetical protein